MASVSAQPAGKVVRRRKSSGSVISEAGRFGVPALLVILAAFFSILRPTSFETIGNFRSIIDTNSEIVILAFAAMIPLVAGEFDLSIVANAGLANVVVLGLVIDQHLAVWIAVLGALAGSTAVGVINGLVITYLRVPAFIATLGMGSLLEAFGLWYTGGGQILNGPPALTNISLTWIHGVPLPVVYTFVIGIIFYIVMNNVPVGRRLYAVGGNRRAAELTGIATRKYLLMSFVIAGLFAGISGVILGARLGSATVDSTSSLLLPVFAAVFLGATTIKPGRFNVAGTWVSVYFLAVAISGLDFLGAPVWAQPLFNGLVLISAVALSGWAFRRRASKARREHLRELQQSASQSADGRGPEAGRDVEMKKEPVGLA